ncbi:MAG: hypothetical protein ACK5D5_04735 [Bacteroidota bacterium]
MKKLFAVMLLVTFFAKAQNNLNVKLHVLEGRKTEVIESFVKDKTYTLCSGKTKLSKIDLSGSMDNIGIYIKQESDNKVIFAKTKLNISNGVSFNQRELPLKDGETYIVTIKKGNTQIFEGTLESSSCN